MTGEGATLLVDVGSTVVKLCVHREGTGLGAVEFVPREPHTAPGEQVRALVARHRPSASAGVRICSSANGGVRVGVLGLSLRHSTAAAVRAAVAAGGNVVYQRLLGGGPEPAPLPPVDLLVLVGGVDGADVRHLRHALEHTKLADAPHELLVWAGADAPDVVAGLPVDHVVANVLDERLRPSMAGLTDLIHHVYVEDLVDRKGLRPLAGIADTPIWPTPAVVELAAEGLIGGRPRPVATPFVVVDVGGATTDALYCTELRAPGPLRVAPGESITRQVFTDLGVAASLPALRRLLATEPELFELTAAVAPERARSLHHGLSEGAEGSLDPPAGFLACLYLAVRRLTSGVNPPVEASRIAGFVITGGARGGTGEPAVRRVIAAAAGLGDARFDVHLDRDYTLWATGLLAVPSDPR